MAENWPCPCCGRLTLPAGPGDYEVCPVCDWEDDLTQLRWPLYADGANGISLVEAQSNYQRIGAMAHEALERVQPPLPFDVIADGWRPIDLSRDNVERRTRLPLRATWPNDLTVLYWWRPTYWRRRK